MNKQKIADRYLPLTEMTYYILLGMVSRGSYEEIIGRVKTITKGDVTLGLGTIYATTQKLLKDGVITEEEEYESEQVTKYYKLTLIGEYILKEEYLRIEKLFKNSYITMKSIT